MVVSSSEKEEKKGKKRKEESKSFAKDMSYLTATVLTENSYSSLLELVADNDVKSFKKVVESNILAVDEIGLWYGQQKHLK
ncbi:hypothetical protein RJ641_034163 [Dillenia turbinata]|uniref:Uncharacterized protein n=1 Tax=Dillenia turbinata TaxID=194707 RepID=A0AAN8VL90_9MAGN